MRNVSPEGLRRRLARRNIVAMRSAAVLCWVLPVCSACDLGVCSTTQLLKEAACDLEWRPYSSLNEVWGWAMNGSFNYVRDYGILKMGTHATDLMGSAPQYVASEQVMIGECGRKATGGFWYTNKVGVFRTDGGNGWHVLNFVFQRPAESARTIGIGKHIQVVVDTNGVLLGLPPIHLHHITATQSPFSHVDDPGYLGLRAHDALVAITTGDWMNPSEKGGADGYAEDYGGDVKLISGDLRIGAFLNDVRPASSPEISWSFQVSFFLVESPAPTQRALSVIEPALPAEDVPPFYTTDVPCGKESFFIGMYSMPFDGFDPLILHHTYHAHQPGCQDSLLFRGRLPITDSLYGPFITTNTEWPTNAQLRAHLLEHHGDDLLYQARCRLENGFDRYAGITVGAAAAAGWQFHRGDVLTHATFYRPPDTCDTFPTHSAFQLYLISDDGKSYYGNLNIIDGKYGNVGLTYLLRWERMSKSLPDGILLVVAIGACASAAAVLLYSARAPRASGKPVSLL